jgi:hypothetical protein
MEKKEKEESKEEIFDVIVKQDNLSKSLKEKAYERRMELINLIKVRGFFKARLQYKALALHYGVAERQIYNDFDWIKGNYTPTDLRELKIDLSIGRDRALSEALKLLEDAKEIEERARAIVTLISVVQKCREELEGWGEKEKIADKHEVTQKTLKLSFVRHDGTPIENRGKDSFTEVKS